MTYRRRQAPGIMLLMNTRPSARPPWPQNPTDQSLANERRDLEVEREELLRQIEAALPDNVRKAIQASYQLPGEPKVMLTTNEVGAACADQG